MSWRVFIRPVARTDLREARDWYERQRAGLGDEFLLAVADAMVGLEESPLRFPVYYRDFRRALVERFPYKVFFWIEAMPSSSFESCTPPATMPVSWIEASCIRTKSASGTCRWEATKGGGDKRALRCGTRRSSRVRDSQRVLNPEP